MNQLLTIFGPNLRDQSKGDFVVHAADCADCAKLRAEQWSRGEYTSQDAVLRDLYSDHIAEGSCTIEDARGSVHFAPCVKVL